MKKKHQQIWNIAVFEEGPHNQCIHIMPHPDNEEARKEVIEILKFIIEKLSKKEEK